MSNSESSSRRPSAFDHSQSSRSNSPQRDGRNAISSGPKMPDFLEQFKISRRLSFPFVKNKHKHQAEGDLKASVECDIESPPAVFYEIPANSTGALVSGQLILDVKTESLEIDSFRGALSIHVSHKRPFHRDCRDCQHQYTELKGWDFLIQTTTLHRGKHKYPFSILIKGELPVSLDTNIIRVEYELSAKLSIACDITSSVPNLCRPVNFLQKLPVRRSIQLPEIPHRSIRLFPPTNITVDAQFLRVVHATSPNKVELRLDGLMVFGDKGKMVDLWKVRKISWRLEEWIKTVSPACDKHLPAAACLEGSDQTKGIQRAERRILGEKMFLSGWKSDYSGRDGLVEMEFTYACKRPKSNHKEHFFACDLEGTDTVAPNTGVSHTLTIEIVVSKEYAPAGKPELSAHSGTGRILRLKFDVVVTDDGGLGISWDNEVPPVYDEVPPSPPPYNRKSLSFDEVRDSEPPIEYSDLQPLEAVRSTVEEYERSRRGR